MIPARLRAGTERTETMAIEVKLLPTGYYRAQGQGPCEWAQWPKGEPLRDEHFFPEASAKFREGLRKRVSG
jgi:hypothetical protein